MSTSSGNSGQGPTFTPSAVNAPVPSNPNNKPDDGLAKLKKDFMRQFPKETSKYRFQGLENARRTYLHERDLFNDDTTASRSEFIIFTCVHPEILEQIPENDTLPISSYEKPLHILVLKMPSEPREIVGGQFEDLMAIKSAGMGVHNELVSRGGAGVTSSRRTKQPDCSYRPIHPPGTRTTQWPTLVVEVGYSESAAKLEADATWWLNDSGVNNGVQIAVTISIKQNKREIIFRKYERVHKSTRKQPDRMVPTIVQQITLSKPTDDAPVKVSSSPFVLSFEKVLLRDPAAGEGDISFSENDLRTLADKVWPGN
ncbi:hypothetical protein FQN55_000879 [Onygenales sp. PD_40]|nr:hypothetical protein FQN55_000879 [Onygenales sp. PD_40]KAK2786792.1 hypothetical protein FQN53_006089 [Emmonsiellopsis sp. PD_33]KAK2796252.1 hypothetical protein FQN51_009461 [Onygenales sp. PD_10]